MYRENNGENNGENEMYRDNDSFVGALREPCAKADLKATILLRKYDQMKRELAQLEPALRKASVDYGLRRGMYGFSPDHLRTRLAYQSDRTMCDADAA